MDRPITIGRNGASGKRRGRVLTATVGVIAVLGMLAPTALADPGPSDPPPPAPFDASPPPVDPAGLPVPGEQPAGVPVPPVPGQIPAGVPVPPVPGQQPGSGPLPVQPQADQLPGQPPAAQPGGPSDPNAPTTIPEGTAAGQNPTPFTGTAPFRPPTFNPSNGAVVGVAKPIIINFAVPIADKPMAEQAIHISSNPPVPGKFYWMNDSQVRWRPLSFWPAHTSVNIDAAGTISHFTTGDSLVATVDNATHQMTITRNGNVVQTFPESMGMPGRDTPNGTYYVLEKFPDIVMDSATYGVPNTSAQGYKVHVQLAVRFDNSGNFVHSAPWSVADQGKRNVSHGCINISPSNAQWFFDNFGSGDAIVVKNSVGSYTQNDGAQDWQI